MAFFKRLTASREKNYQDSSQRSANTESELPPAYSDIFPTHDPGLSSPPEYSHPPDYSSLFTKQDSSSFLEDIIVKIAAEREEEQRCSTCFDPIMPDKKEGFSGEMVQTGPHQFYHYECYLRSKGPRCAHCSFPLIANPDRGLSGRWGIYDQKKYHEECYKFAGPRCASCFDVIVEDEELGYSGRWRQDEFNKLLHEECFVKRLYAEARSK